MRILSRVRGIHGLEMIIVFVLFLGIILWASIAQFDERGTKIVLAEELKQAEELELEMVFSDMRPNNGEGWTQGFTVTDKYFVVVSTVFNGRNTITAYDKETLRKVKTINCSIGHGNDLAFNSNTNEIVAFGGESNEIKFFDADSLEEMPERQINLGTELMPVANGNSISYDATSDKYFLISPTTGLRVWDGDFVPTETVYDTRSAFNLSQTVSYHGGYLLYSLGCSLGRGICNAAQDDWTDGLVGGDESYAPSTGAVIAYNAQTGRRDAMFLIPPTDSNGKYYGELEGASVDEKNEIYFIFSSYNDDFESVGKGGSFVVFKLAKDSKVSGNKSLRKMLNRKLSTDLGDFELEPALKAFAF